MDVEEVRRMVSRRRLGNGGGGSYQCWRMAWERVVVRLKGCLRDPSSQDADLAGVWWIAWDSTTGCAATAQFGVFMSR